MNIDKTSSAASSAPLPSTYTANQARRNQAAPSTDERESAVRTSQPAVAPAAMTQDTVSVSKVAQMRAAIESGTFKMDFEKIAEGIMKSGDLTRNV